MFFSTSLLDILQGKVLCLDLIKAFGGVHAFRRACVYVESVRKIFSDLKVVQSASE